MTEWWEKAYRGGGPAKVKGFPRPLYPPDVPKSSGYEPSSRGPDVIAYKRTVSRLGRWPWQTFDDGYWNDFAHGEPGGNVGDSGVEGVQRQQKISASGWLGKQTFDNLRYCLVPEGKQHAGEQAMDHVACDLINEAWEMFQGKAPPAAYTPLKRKYIPSPNYSSRGGSSVRLIVLHTAEGATTIESLGNFFASSSAGVSSHAGADDQKGIIGEYVRRPDKAWTQANANPYSVSLELCAFAKWSSAQWNEHPNMLENCARWIAEEAKQFGIPITKLTASQAQGGGRGVCQHVDLGSMGGGHWDCGGSFPMDKVLNMAKGYNV